MRKKLAYLPILPILYLLVLTLAGMVCPRVAADPQQTKNGTVSFSWSNTLQKSQSFSLLGASVSVSVKVDMSLNMPVTVTSTSNVTTARAGSNAWLKVSMAGGSAGVSVTVAASASIGSTTKSTTQSWSKSFTTPLGTPAQIGFPQFSIPAIDAVIGQATVDLTPEVSFQGSVVGNSGVQGPCTMNAQSLTWATANTQQTMNATINDQADVHIALSASAFKVTQMELGSEIGATVKTMLGSKSVDLGYLGLPIQAAFSLDGSPSSLVLAEYLPPTPPSPAISFLTLSLDQNMHRYTVNQSVSFSAESSSPGSGTITGYTWDFGDGSPTENSPSVAHSYAATGIFTVKLTLLNSDGLSATTTETVSVGKAPLPPINLYWVLAGVGSVFGIGTIAAVSMRMKRAPRKRTGSNSAVAEPVEGEALEPLVSEDYATGAFCSIDKHPLDGSTKVLKCPKCGTNFHEGCLLAMLELAPSCPECGFPLRPTGA